ncbi:RNA polymerase, sigma subunit, ECF family [Cognatiyoonia koreensis]|uniref:RNA polymerase, sigma subunit, ECF family n=2 Tax=Cognatiyoonia koreensis TaxID=364200 RepID=A0A1I0QEA9_9RHOB|nr:RNA polymerase, sigma subunit, ECF family [Cognatiyoonia koreensis]
MVAKVTAADMVVIAAKAPFWQGFVTPADCHAVQSWIRPAPMTDLSSLSESALLVAFANGDGDAARLLTDRLLPRVLGQATRMLADRAEAEDVAQEAMLRLWRVAPDWRQGEAQVSTWLYRVTANLCTDRLRRRRGNVALDQIAEPEDPSPSATARMQTLSRQRALSDALATLPDRQAQAVALRHLEGLSNPEIAEVMDITVTSVESLTARGKRALAEVLAAQKDALGYQDDT